MEQAKVSQARKQYQTKIKPEYPPLGQHALDKRKIAESVACPEPIPKRRQQITNSQHQSNAGQHCEHPRKSIQPATCSPAHDQFPGECEKREQQARFLTEERERPENAPPQKQPDSTSWGVRFAPAHVTKKRHQQKKGRKTGHALYDMEHWKQLYRMQ